MSMETGPSLEETLAQKMQSTLDAYYEKIMESTPEADDGSFF